MLLTAYKKNKELFTAILTLAAIAAVFGKMAYSSARAHVLDARYEIGVDEAGDIASFVEKVPGGTLLDAYTAVVHSFGYDKGRAGEVPEGDGWESEWAGEMLRTGKGNCCSFAAVFCECARRMGYDAHTVICRVAQREEETDHCVVIIKDASGSDRIYDAAFDATPQPNHAGSMEYFCVGKEAYKEHGGRLYIDLDDGAGTCCPYRLLQKRLT